MKNKQDKNTIVYAYKSERYYIFESIFYEINNTVLEELVGLKPKNLRKKISQSEKKWPKTAFAANQKKNHLHISEIVIKSNISLFVFFSREVPRNVTDRLGTKSNHFFVLVIFIILFRFSLFFCSKRIRSNSALVVLFCWSMIRYIGCQRKKATKHKIYLLVPCWFNSGVAAK